MSQPKNQELTHPVPQKRLGHPPQARRRSRRQHGRVRAWLPRHYGREQPFPPSAGKPSHAGVPGEGGLDICPDFTPLHRGVPFGVVCVGNLCAMVE